MHSKQDLVALAERLKALGQTRQLVITLYEDDVDPVTSIPENGLDVFSLSLLGSSKSEVLSGGNLNDYIRAEGGDDIVYGLGGDDILWGRPGDDVLYGGEGNDGFQDLWGVNEFYGESGNDYIYLRTDDVLAGNILDGGDGDDRVFLGMRDDHVDIVIDLSKYENVTQGITLRSIESIFIQTSRGSDDITGGASADTLELGWGDDFGYGAGGDDVLNGENGSDVLGGGEGNDQITGGRGNDILHGEAGDDILVGGSGKDMLSGGEGADRFVFAAGDSRAGGSARDVISDFTSGVDTIDLSALNVADYAQQVSFKEVGSGLIVYVDTDQDGFDYSDFAVQLNGVSLMQVSDFLL